MSRTHRGVIVLVLLAGSAGAQTWTLLSPSVAPSRRGNFCVATDLARARVLLFGDNVARQPETWQWDGAAWLQVATTGPPARVSAGMAHDLSRGRTVLFGGSGGGQRFADTWEWNGAAWHRVIPARSPRSRESMGMAYDARGRIVMFGGYDAAARTYLSDTWEWDGVSWRERMPALHPSARGATLACDPIRGRVVLFGGVGSTGLRNDTWEWDGTGWLQMAPPVRPAVRNGHMMSFDYARGRVVMFGGINLQGTLQDLWEWDGARWSELVVPPGPQPSPRFGGGLSYDVVNGVLLQFGGVGAAFFNDTWLCKVAPALYIEFGTGCVGTAGVPRLSPVDNGVPWINSTFVLRLSGLPSGAPALLLFGGSSSRWGATPLPLQLGSIGMPGCNLLVSPDLSVPAPPNGSSAVLALSIPANPWFVGRRLYQQGLVLDPGANAVGVVLSNGGEALFGCR